MKTPNKLTLITTASLLMVTLGSNVYAQANQVSLEVIKNIGDKRFWQSNVQCNNKADFRYIEKQIDSSLWCLQLSPTVCFEEKNIAADKACSDGYDDVILATRQLTEAINTTSKSTTSVALPSQTYVDQNSTISNQVSTLEASIDETPSTYYANNTVTNSAQEFIDEDDDDDVYFNIEDLLNEKVQLEAELFRVQQQKLELNQRKTQLQNSLSPY